MKRVVHICTDPDFWRFNDVILRHLIARGFEVHAISRAAETSPLLDGIVGLHRHSLHITRAIDPVADLRSLRALTHLLKRLKPDLVHAHTPKGGLLGMTAAALSGTSARIYQAHGLRYQTAQGKRRALLLAAERSSCALATQVIFVSRSVQSQALKDRALNTEKSIVLAHGSAQGLNLSDYDPAALTWESRAFERSLNIKPDSKALLYLSRLARDKGLADLQIAWQNLRKRFPNLHLIVAGRVDQTDPVELTALENDPRVHMVGHLADPRPALLCCSALVLPSYREGLPQGVLEASALGIPVVATRVTGIVDAVLHEKTGILVEPHAPKALEKALAELLENPQKARDLGAAGRLFVAQNFTQQPILEALDKVYARLLSAHDCTAAMT